MKENSKTMIGYNAAYELSKLVGRLVIVHCTLDNFDKLTAVRETVSKVIQEHQSKLKVIFDEYKIDKFPKETHPKFEEIAEKLTDLILSPSSTELSAIQVYQPEEIIEMTKEAKVKFDFNELSILLSALKASTN